MKSPLVHVIEETAAKFGEVLAAKKAPHSCYYLLVRRSSFLIDGGKFMDIRVIYDPNSGALAMAHATDHHSNYTDAMAAYERRPMGEYKGE